MALATNAIDINRSTTGIVLPPEMSTEIWASAEHESAIMSLVQRVSIPGSGLTIPVITGDPAADWVAETAEKPVSNSTFSSKQMTPYKIAVIEVFSNEFRRDLPALYAELVRRLPAAIGKKFDATVFNGTAPGSNFDVLSNVAAQSITATANATVYQNLLAAYGTVGTFYALNGWALSPQGEVLVLGATDTTGRPIFTDSARDDAIGRILGAPVVRASQSYAAGTPNVLGFAGDWSQARYGIVDGINISISDQATVNDGTQQINLWQRNCFAVRCEAELAFVADTAAFVKLTA